MILVRHTAHKFYIRVSIMSASTSLMGRGSKYCLGDIPLAIAKSSN